MLELKPVGPLSWSFDITRDGVSVGALDLRRLKANGTLRLDGREFEIKRDGFPGPFVFSEQDHVLARARRKALLGPKYEITADDRTLLLASKGLLMRTAQVLHGDVVIATIRRTSLFRRQVRIESSANDALPLVLFAATLMILFWRQQSRSSS